MTIRPVSPTAAVRPSADLYAVVRQVSSTPRGEWEAAASEAAWTHRAKPWPVTFEALTVAVPDGLLLPAAYVCARRLQFGHTHDLLYGFSTAALERFEDDPFLTVLQAAARVAARGARCDWQALRDLAARSATVTHVWLGTVAAHPLPPTEEARLALGAARERAEAGDHVAACRVVSILRLVGRHHEAFESLTAAHTLLVTDPPAAVLHDTLVDVLARERALLQEGLRGAAAAPLTGRGRFSRPRRRRPSPDRRRRPGW